MDWEQKLDALNSLAECSLKMRRPGDWYVSQHTEVGGDGLLTGLYGNGLTPEEAVNDHWNQLVENLPSDRHIRTHDNKSWRWAGFMWKEVPNG